MDPIENYNANQTKAVLTNLYSDLCENKSNDASYLFNIIYNFLGVDFTNEAEDYFSSTPLDENIFDNLIPQSTISVNESLNAEYGDYFFHIFNEDAAINERMIINTKAVIDSIHIFNYLRTAKGEAIARMKFFAQNKPTKSYSLKCDKIVIYYDKDNRDAVCDLVASAAAKYEVKFQTPLSAFYDIYHLNNSSDLIVGIGQEPAEGDMSFTEKNATAILNELIIKGLATYKDKETFANAMFDTVADQLK